MRVIHVLRKPCSREAGTVAANVLRWGTGALNTDATRVGFTTDETSPAAARRAAARASGNAPMQARVLGVEKATEANKQGRIGRRGSAEVYMAEREGEQSGRWPANLILSHAPDCGEVCAPGCPVAALDAQSGVGKSTVRPPTGKDDRGVPGFTMRRVDSTARGHDDAGGASRYFKQFSNKTKE